MVLNAIRFLLLGLMTNKVTILINFQLNFALVQDFSIGHQISERKRLLACLKSDSKSSSSWQGKCDVISLELRSGIARSNLPNKMTVPQSCKSGRAFRIGFGLKISKCRA